MDSVSMEEMATLQHTMKNGRFCGGEHVTQSLAERGYLRCIGRPSWVPDPYYVLTDKGRDMVKAFTDPRKLPLQF